jgi:hypothetical protein
MKLILSTLVMFSWMATADQAYKNFSGIYEGDLSLEQLHEPQLLNEFAVHLGLLQEAPEDGDSLVWRASYASSPDTDYQRRRRRPGRDRGRRPSPSHPRGPFYQPVPSFAGMTCFATNGYLVFWGQSWDAYSAQAYAQQACLAYTGFYCQALNCQLNYY